MKCSICDKIKKKGTAPEDNLICKKCVSEEMHRYYLKNKEKITKRNDQWRSNNKNRVVGHSKKYRTRLKIDALKAYSNNKAKCACCGEKEIDFLCLDHINNDGKEDRKKTGLGTSFLKWLKVHNYPKDLKLQVLCFNCNMSKRIQGGICIHQKKLTSNKS